MRIFSNFSDNLILLFCDFWGNPHSINARLYLVELKECSQSQQRRGIKPDFCCSDTEQVIRSSCFLPWVSPDSHGVSPMVPTGYERENSQEGPHWQVWQVSLCKPCLPSHFLFLLQDWWRLCKVLMCCCGQDSSTCKAAAHWLLAVAPAHAFDLLCWLAVLWRATSLLPHSPHWIPLAVAVSATADTRREEDRGPFNGHLEEMPILARRGCAVHQSLWTLTCPGGRQWRCQ